MKLYIIIDLFKQYMSGADILPVLFFSLAILICLIIALCRWGAGILISLTLILTGFMLIASEVVRGFALVLRFPLIMILAFYALFSRKNKIHFSRAEAVWLLLAVVMLLNSLRAYHVSDALLQSFLFLGFFVGVMLGGQKILGDERGRAAFTGAIVFFSIVMTCVQIPFLSSFRTRFAGIFTTPVGFMIVGSTGVIFLAWFSAKQRFGSLRFVIYTSLCAATFIIMVLTGGRTAIASTLLGLVVLLARKLRRNVVIFLAVSIIVAPVGLKLVTSLPGFEDLKRKLFSTRMTGRAELYSHAWEQIKTKPLTGWGTGTAFVKSAAVAGMTYHQSYLELAVDHGIPFALLILIVFCWYPFRGLFLMKKCQTEEMRDMANLSSALLAGYVFSSFFSGVLNATTFVLPIYGVVALQEGVRAQYQEMKLSDWMQYEEESTWPYEQQGTTSTSLSV